jgi:Bifunctional DNA primase/polymerase, N-terminal
MTTEHIRPGGIPVNWYLFPIRAGTKDEPLVKQNLTFNASNDPRQIAAWRRQHPGCNFGIALARSNLLVVDVDVKPGKVGQRTFDLLDIEYGFPSTYTVRSPSGGRHLYFRGRHVFALGKNGFGLDIDSPNYVLAPGSRLVRPDGTVGMWRALNNLPPVAPAPSWFYTLLGERKRAAVEQTPVIELDTPSIIEAAIHYVVHHAPLSVQGQGGEQVLFYVACRLKDQGVSEYQAVEILAEHWNARCSPPWNVRGGNAADDLAAKVRNAYSYGTQNAPGCDTAEFHFAGDVIEPGEIDRARKWWTGFDRDWRVLHSTTLIDGELFPAVRTPRSPPRKKKAGRHS